MKWKSMSHWAPKYVSNENKIPVTNINDMDTLNTRLAPNISFRATLSAVMIEIATGTPAVDTLKAKK